MSDRGENEQAKCLVQEHEQETQTIFFTFSHQKTVVAVLDQLVNPHWPYLPEKIKETGEKSDRIERAWSSVPDDPLNYDFFYHVLEADDLGQEPKDDEGNLIEEFNPKSMSPLRCIAESDDKVPKKSIHTVIHAVGQYHVECNLLQFVVTVNFCQFPPTPPPPLP